MNSKTVITFIIIFAPERRDMAVPLFRHPQPKSCHHAHQVEQETQDINQVLVLEVVQDLQVEMD